MFAKLQIFVRQSAISFAIVRQYRKVFCFTKLPFRSRAIRSYLNRHEIPKLQIGTGQNVLEDWLNTDVYPRSGKVLVMDALKTFPFEDCAFEYVFSEHQIEELGYKGSLAMLRECHRVLRPGGGIRVATTSLDALLALGADSKSDLEMEYIKWITDQYLPDVGIYSGRFVINNAFHRLGKRFLFDQETLWGAMEQAGFVEITRCAHGVSERPAFQKIERHGVSVSNESMANFETMVLQGIRPT